MNLLEFAQQDIAAISSDTAAGFGTDLTFEHGEATVTVGGLASKHFLSVDEVGVAKRGKTSTCSVSGLVLNAAGYTYRNAKGEVDFKGHKVSWKDVTGLTKKYVIDVWFPDEVTGLIGLQISDLE